MGLVELAFENDREVAFALRVVFDVHDVPTIGTQGVEFAQRRAAGPQFQPVEKSDFKFIFAHDCRRFADRKNTPLAQWSNIRR